MHELVIIMQLSNPIFNPGRTLESNPGRFMLIFMLVWHSCCWTEDMDDREQTRCNACRYNTRHYYDDHLSHLTNPGLHFDPDIPGLFLTQERFYQNTIVVQNTQIKQKLRTIPAVAK